jgi:hypothetical protein
MHKCCCCQKAHGTMNLASVAHAIPLQNIHGGYVVMGYDPRALPYINSSHNTSAQLFWAQPLKIVGRKTRPIVLAMLTAGSVRRRRSILRLMIGSIIIQCFSPVFGSLCFRLDLCSCDSITLLTPQGEEGACMMYVSNNTRHVISSGASLYDLATLQTCNSKQLEL